MAISMATANHGGMGFKAALGVLAMPHVTAFPQLREAPAGFVVPAQPIERDRPPTGHAGEVAVL
jgi:hypothetical protein